MKKIIFIFLTVFLLIFNLAAQISLAADTAPAGIEEINPADYGLPPTHVRLTTLINTILKWVVYIAGTACVAVLIFAGIKYAFAGGDESKIEEAKKFFKYALIGIIVISSSYIITQIIIKLISEDTQPPNLNTTSQMIKTLYKTM